MSIRSSKDGSKLERVCLDRVEIDRISFDATVTQVMDWAGQAYTRVRQVVTVNAQFVGAAHSDTRLARVIREAALSVADGVPLVWASQLLRRPLPGRVNGTDLMVRLCEVAPAAEASVYFFGGHPGSATAAAARLSETCRGLRIAGIDCPPHGFSEVAALDHEAAEKIRHAAPDIVFVALGAPKAEFWIQEHGDLPAKVMIGVGGSFELVGGMIQRAPVVFQKAGCEWLWRLVMEPRRLWKRYLLGNALFVWLILRQWLGGERRAASE